MAINFGDSTLSTQRSRRFFAFVILTRDKPVLRFNADKRKAYGTKLLYFCLPVKSYCDLQFQHIQ